MLLFAAGLFSYNRLGRAEDPSFTMKVMVVSAIWPGATAAETQAQVAERIERKLQDLPHLDKLDTFSRPGAVFTLLALRDDTPPADVPGLFYQVRKKLDDLRPDLPAGVQHVSMPFEPGAQRFVLQRDGVPVFDKTGEHDISRTDGASRCNYSAGSAR